MNLGRLYSAIVIPLVSFALIWLGFIGVTQGVDALRNIVTSWLAWPLVVIVALSLVGGIYRVLGWFGKDEELLDT